MLGSVLSSGVRVEDLAHISCTVIELAVKGGDIGLRRAVAVRWTIVGRGSIVGSGALLVAIVHLGMAVAVAAGAVLSVEWVRRRGAVHIRKASAAHGGDGSRGGEEMGRAEGRRAAEGGLRTEGPPIVPIVLSMLVVWVASTLTSALFLVTTASILRSRGQTAVAATIGCLLWRHAGSVVGSIMLE